MPSSATFTIKPIAELIREELSLTPGLWVDPFAGYNSPAQITNDLNPSAPTNFHATAVDFLKGFSDCSINGVLYDPPYSQRQIKECYQAAGVKTTQQITQLSFWSKVKDEIARILAPGGKVICCGWNTNGVGINRGFEMSRILLVAHGCNHNDTVVTVETKVK